jgi:hypothetical protein
MVEQAEAIGRDFHDDAGGATTATPFPAYFWPRHIAAARKIDALDEPPEWRAARLAALSRSAYDVERWMFDLTAARTADEITERSRREDEVAEYAASSSFRFHRPARRMPSVITIARHWAARDTFTVDLDHPHCFGCRVETDAWSNSFYERAHLVDRVWGGLDHAGNLALLCATCHRGMPTFDVDEGEAAIEWVVRGGILNPG